MAAVHCFFDPGSQAGEMLMGIFPCNIDSPCAGRIVGADNCYLERHLGVKHIIDRRDVIVEIVLSGLGIIGSQPDKTDPLRKGNIGQLTYRNDSQGFLWRVLPGLVNYEIHG